MQIKGADEEERLLSFWNLHVYFFSEKKNPRIVWNKKEAEDIWVKGQGKPKTGPEKTTNTDLKKKIKRMEPPDNKLWSSKIHDIKEHLVISVFL